MLGIRQLSIREMAPECRPPVSTCVLFSGAGLMNACHFEEVSLFSSQDNWRPVTQHSWDNTVSQSDPSETKLWTLMDIDHPEEFFEPRRLWRLRQGSIFVLTQLWSLAELITTCCQLRHTWSVLPRVLQYLVNFTNCWSQDMWTKPAVPQWHQHFYGLQTFSQPWAGRGHLIGFVVISEKPDKTLPKTLFWHSLIIHSIWWRSGTLKVFLQGL